MGQWGAWRGSQPSPWWLLPGGEGAYAFPEHSQWGESLRPLSLGRSPALRPRTWTSRPCHGTCCSPGWLEDAPYVGSNEYGPPQVLRVWLLMASMCLLRIEMKYSVMQKPIVWDKDKKEETAEFQMPRMLITYPPCLHILGCIVFRYWFERLVFSFCCDFVSWPSCVRLYRHMHEW